jgi:hypothetical protein
VSSSLQQALAAVDGVKGVSKHERQHRHELHHNVEGLA